MSVYTLHKNLERREHFYTVKRQQKRVILYEKLRMNDEKTHVDPCPHNGIQLGLKDHCVPAYFIKVGKPQQIIHICRQVFSYSISTFSLKPMSHACRGWGHNILRWSFRGLRPTKASKIIKMFPSLVWTFRPFYFSLRPSQSLYCNLCCNFKL